MRNVGWEQPRFSVQQSLVTCSSRLCACVHGGPFLRRCAYARLRLCAYFRCRAAPLGRLARCAGLELEPWPTEPAAGVADGVVARAFADGSSALPVQAGGIHKLVAELSESGPLFFFKSFL